MANVGSLDTRLEEFNSKMGSDIGAMSSSVATLQESVKDSGQKYTDVSQGISGSWTTSNNKMTIQALDLIKEAIEQIAGATEILKSALEDCGRLKEIVDKILADIEEGKPLKEAETVEDKDENGNVIGTHRVENDQKRIDELKKEVDEYNEKGKPLLDAIIAKLATIKLSIIEATSGSGGLFTEFVEMRNKTFINSDIDIDALYELCHSKKIKELGENESIYNYVDKGELDLYLANLTQGTTGRDKTTLAAVGLIKFLAEKGVGINYDRGGKDPKTGIDCSGFVSWSLDQSINFQYIGSKNFTTDYLGAQEVYYGNLQYGDVLSSPGNHVMLVVKNDPLTETIYTAEAGAPVQIKKYSYRDLKYAFGSEGYTGLDMTNVYASGVPQPEGVRV